MLRLLRYGLLLCLTCMALAVGAKVAGGVIAEGDRIAYFANDEIGSVYAIDITRGLRIPLATWVLGGTISFSPTGELMFANSDYEVFSIDRYGDVRQLSPEGLRAQSPVWSSDGAQIALIIADESDTLKGHLIVIDHDGQNRHDFALEISVNNIYPIWVGDNTQILLPQSYVDGLGFRDLLVDSVSGNVRDLYMQDGIAPNTTYITDDGRILLLAVTSSGRELYLAHVLADGHVEVERTPLFTIAPATVAFDFQWSPDGTQLAFTLLENGNYEIMILDDSGNLHNLSVNAARDDSPSWSADGSQLAFLSNRGSSSQLYVVNADGGEVRSVVSNVSSSVGWRPTWLP